MLKFDKALFINPIKGKAYCILHPTDLFISVQYSDIPGQNDADIHKLPNMFYGFHFIRGVYSICKINLWLLKAAKKVKSIVRKVIDQSSRSMHNIRLDVRYTKGLPMEEGDADPYS